MRLLIVGEGAHEQIALPVFVERLLSIPVEIDFCIIRDKRAGRLHGKGPRLFKRALLWLRYAERERYDGVVLLTDEDGDRGRIQQMDRAQDERSLASISRALGVAIRTFDAWFLADEVALTEVLDRPTARQPDPESDRSPKDRCLALVDETNAALGLGELYRRLASSIELTRLEQRCPNGFAPFAARLRTLRRSG